MFYPKRTPFSLNFVEILLLFFRHPLPNREAINTDTTRSYQAFPPRHISQSTGSSTQSCDGNLALYPFRNVKTDRNLPLCVSVFMSKSECLCLCQSVRVSVSVSECLCAIISRAWKLADNDCSWRLGSPVVPIDLSVAVVMFLFCWVPGWQVTVVLCHYNDCIMRWAEGPGPELRWGSMLILSITTSVCPMCVTDHYLNHTNRNIPHHSSAIRRNPYQPSIYMSLISNLLLKLG